ncbi:hypothetical protein EVG20_g847 [Dentipellis fragilis]|uniref:Uncharacterized protein n=1 Tax=Dentipellis fragilis TaxID=205917 RepID=A0A4Y9ZCE7_9AGAM|nr:hypothetical protein EVG20_g847 [Dentipellis fragilis]
MPASRTASHYSPSSHFIVFICWFAPDDTFTMPNYSTLLPLLIDAQREQEKKEKVRQYGVNMRRQIHMGTEEMLPLVFSKEEVKKKTPRIPDIVARGGQVLTQIGASAQRMAPMVFTPDELSASDPSILNVVERCEFLTAHPLQIPAVRELMRVNKDLICILENELAELRRSQDALEEENQRLKEHIASVSRST